MGERWGRSVGIGGLLHHGSEILLSDGRWARLYWDWLALSTPTWGPCDRCRARMPSMQARFALLSQPLCAHTAAQHPISVPPLAALPSLAESSWSLLDTVDRIPPWHQGRVDTGDDVCDVEHPGARPVRRAPWLLAEGEIIVHRIFTRDTIVTESTTRRAPDSGRRCDPTPLCRPDDR
jgi:hypothetical protein